VVAEARGPPHDVVGAFVITVNRRDKSISCLLLQGRGARPDISLREKDARFQQ
jgi:hypothetical protein